MGPEEELLSSLSSSWSVRRENMENRSSGDAMAAAAEKNKNKTRRKKNATAQHISWVCENGSLKAAAPPSRLPSPVPLPLCLVFQTQWQQQRQQQAQRHPSEAVKGQDEDGHEKVLLLVSVRRTYSISVVVAAARSRFVRDARRLHCSSSGTKRRIIHFWSNTCVGVCAQKYPPRREIFVQATAVHLEQQPQTEHRMIVYSFSTTIGVRYFCCRHHN